MSVLYIIRHGQASFGQADYDRLSELGLRQARLTGQYLRATGVALDAAYAGGMARQRDTAGAVLAQLPQAPALSVLPSLDEYDSAAIIQALLPAMLRENSALQKSLPGMYQDRRSFQAIYEAAMGRWIGGQYQTDGVETWRSFLARAQGALRQVLRDNQGGKTVAVFTSGGTISAILLYALGLLDQMALQMTWVIRNASISSFFYNQRGLTLSTFNSTAHLEQQAEPGLLTYR